MTLPEVNRLLRYWEHTPPMRVLVEIIARQLGWTPSERADAAPGLPSANEQIAALPEFEE